MVVHEINICRGNDTMKKLLLTAIVAASALAGAAQAGTASNEAYMQAARCRGLAVSEGLGTVDAAAVTAFLEEEGKGRDAAVRFKVGTTVSNARKEGDRARGAAKERLLAERSGVCSAYLNGATTGAAVNTAN
jgi:tellurite resistance protein